MPHSRDFADLIEGRTDAMTAYVSNEPFLMEERGQRARIFSPSDVGLSFYGNLLFTSNNRVQSDLKLVRAFMDATLKGWEAAFADVESTIDLIKASYDTQGKSREALRFEATALKRLAYREGLPLGHIGLEKLEKASDAYRLMGIKLSERDLAEFVWHLEDWERFREIGLTASEIAFLDSTLIRAATTTNWAPFAFVDPETKLPSGIGFEYWQEIFSRGGLKSSIRSFDRFPDELQSLKNRQIDVIYSVGETPERREYALFSEPYASFPLVIATSKNQNFIADVAQLEGKTIAVGRNFTAHKMMLAAYPNLDYLLVGNVREGLEAVSSGKAFGFVDIMPVLSYTLNDHGFTNLKISGDMGLVFDLRIMIRKDYPELLSIVNKIIPTIPAHRRLEILNQWSKVTYEQKLRLEAHLSEIVLGSLLIGMLLLWMYQAKTQAQRANRAKSEFLALMSHDLRTPLNAIMGFTDMIRHETFGPIGHERYRGYLDDIHSSGTLLVNLINDILDLSRVEAGKYELAEEEVDVGEICSSVISQCSVIVGSGEIRLQLDCEEGLPALRGDERVLTQMLNNLVSNATKFSERQTEVTLSASLAQNDEIVLKVQDQGIGMTESEIEHVMKPFERVNRYEVRRQEGTGLGLYLCQSFMQLFGGRMEISSKPNAGTTVELVFPSSRTIRS